MSEEVPSSESKNDNTSQDYDEEEWMKELQKVPLLMTEQPDEIDPETSPALAALQALKYENDEDPPEVKAVNYKDDGNFHFKRKRYHQAIAAYTEGIKQNCGDNDLNAQLYNNRGAAQSYLGNNRSALNDATEAKKLSPTYIKAFIRESDNKKLKELKLKAVKNQKVNARNHRKENLLSKKEETSIRNLMQALKEREVTLDGLKSYSDIETMSIKDVKALLTPPDPMGASAMVYLNEEMVIHWPILFIYPEHGQTDFIKSANENDRFMDHLIVMFDDNEAPPWDKENKYKLKNLEIYFEDKDSTQLHRIHLHQTLKEILTDKRFCVKHGIPSFILLVTGSAFKDHFLKK
ncbi:Tetratricopeptide repeat protein 4 [Trichoplax sp. H2]|nr:Tetratricopeptide repeat protein 4 [Trichoplax sp. H2]|eukprot:RDD42202.1 Tetratricopeptide repeat protein 4 [Trichoplax sp. H2]